MPDLAPYREYLFRSYVQLSGKFPLQTSNIAIGSSLWKVTAVPDQDTLLEATETFEQFPYGLLLWESAIGLARHLVENPQLVAGKKVLELGAGVGLVGMVAQSLGAEVWQTDYQHHALQLAGWNARQNHIAGIEQFLADWQLWQHGGQYDILLGADILYERNMHFYLEAIFARNLAPGGSLLLSDPGRPPAMEFAAKLEKAHWQVTLETLPVDRIVPEKEADTVEVSILTFHSTGNTR